jgi:hypothetical protein
MKMEKKFELLLKIIFILLGMIFIFFIAVSLVSLGKLLYFPAKNEYVYDRSSIDKFSKSIYNPMQTGHFHILDQKVYSDDKNPSMCLLCHGNFCHAKSKKLRSYYNMHTFYLTCETCHIRKKKNENILFRWFDDNSGKPLNKIKGSNGSYMAKIVPVKGSYGSSDRLDIFPNEKLARDYMIYKNRYSEEKKKKIQEELMKHISKEAVTCKECHIIDGYLNFSELGYSAFRVNELTNLEIMQLIDEYKNFYLPTMFDPAVSEKNRSND